MVQHVQFQENVKVIKWLLLRRKMKQKNHAFSIQETLLRLIEEKHIALHKYRLLEVLSYLSSANHFNKKFDYFNTSKLLA